MRNQAALKSLSEKAADRFASALAVIQRPVIHIHAHEFIREIASHGGDIARLVPAPVSAALTDRFASRGQ